MLQLEKPRHSKKKKRERERKKRKKESKKAKGDDRLRGDVHSATVAS